MIFLAIFAPTIINLQLTINAITKMLGFTTINEPIKGVAAQKIRECQRRISEGSMKRRTTTKTVYHAEGSQYEIIKG